MRDNNPMRDSNESHGSVSGSHGSHNLSTQHSNQFSYNSNNQHQHNNTHGDGHKPGTSHEHNQLQQSPNCITLSPPDKKIDLQSKNFLKKRSTPKDDNKNIAVIKKNIDENPSLLKKNELKPAVPQKSNEKTRASSHIPMVKVDNSRPQTAVIVSKDSEDFINIYNALKKNMKNVDNFRKQKQQSLRTKLTEASPQKLIKLIPGSLPSSPKTVNKLQLGFSNKRSSFNQEREKGINPIDNTPILEDDNENRRVSLCIINNEGKFTFD